MMRGDMPLLSQWIKKSTCFHKSIFLSMGYEKDIFGSFAYDFELLQNDASTSSI